MSTISTSSLGEKVQRIRSLKIDEQAAQQTAENKKNERLALDKEVRSALEAGETTGDRYFDMAIRTQGTGSEEVLQRVAEKYKGAEALLKGKKGEFVLFPFRARMPRGHSFAGDPMTDGDYFRLGILEGEELVWGNNYPMDFSYMINNGKVLTTLLLPSFHYLEFELTPLLRYELPSQVDIEKYSLLARFPRVEMRYIPYDATLERYLSDGVLIGDEAVGAWLDQKNLTNVRALAEKELKKQA